MGDAREQDSRSVAQKKAQFHRQVTALYPNHQLSKSANQEPETSTRESVIGDSLVFQRTGKPNYQADLRRSKYADPQPEISGTNDTVSDLQAASNNTTNNYRAESASENSIGNPLLQQSFDRVDHHTAAPATNTTDESTLARDLYRTENNSSNPATEKTVTTTFTPAQSSSGDIHSAPPLAGTSLDAAIVRETRESKYSSQTMPLLTDAQRKAK